MRVVHLIELYIGQSRKYLKISRLKYLVVQKYRTKYQKIDRILI